VGRLTRTFNYTRDDIGFLIFPVFYLQLACNGGIGYGVLHQGRQATRFFVELERHSLPAPK
jgi:hypothetical protein